MVDTNLDSATTSNAHNSKHLFSNYLGKANCGFGPGISLESQVLGQLDSARNRARKQAALSRFRPFPHGRGSVQTVPLPNRRSR